MDRQQDNTTQADDGIYDVVMDYDLLFGQTGEKPEDYGEAAIRERIREATNDDTHPSTDADADPQELYDLGYFM